jgi:large subunit ribosomal protein L3
MGYHQRTELNKKIMRVGSRRKAEVNPKGGFVNYGEIQEHLRAACTAPFPDLPRGSSDSGTQRAVPVQGRHVGAAEITYRLDPVSAGSVI